MPLDAINGPTLTIEGRDQAGIPRNWYVRLWNYASGTSEDATITLDLDALAGGFLLPSEADPVWAGDIDRMFISLVPPSFTNIDALLSAPTEGWVELSNIVCEGGGAVLAIGDVAVPPHGYAIATGYDDCYNQTPARVLRNAVHLGYRGSLNHYVGMSHYFRLEVSGGGLSASLNGGALCAPCVAWHEDFAGKAAALNYSVIASLSYELFDAHCWNNWKQRAWNGDPALTGYDPPSTLLSPASTGAMAYLQAVARAFVQIFVDHGHAPRFQVGEPWWWVLPDGRPCLYDASAVAALGGAPVNIPTINSTTLSAVQKALLDAAGALLAASTAALVAAVRSGHAGCQSLLLVYLPTVLDAQAPEQKRANVPVGWAAPAFDILQLEDYDWVTTGNTAASSAAATAMQARLGYPAASQHYFSGFVLNDADDDQWPLIDAAAAVGRSRGVVETFIWAHPQIVRDGFTLFHPAEDDVEAFDDVQFPIAIGTEASVSPSFSTAIVTSASGYEQRNMDWASGRLRFDAGPGLRSVADLQTLIAFFRARRGAAKGFRFRDPLDHSTNDMTDVPTSTDQTLGLGDGVRTSFPLLKAYGVGPEAEIRRITRPDAATLVVAVDGAATLAWALQPKGIVAFNTAPPLGAAVSAGFSFDVPVRFAEDRLEIDCATWNAAQSASVPLIEIREA